MGTKEKILDWIKEHEFTQYQGGWLIHSDDLEEFINKLFDSQKDGSASSKEDEE